MIDLRSDTVTRPTAEMRRAMAEAEVGDDVVDVDPTVARLQDRIAEMLGKPAAIFMPSGTMTNQVGLRLHCRPGDEFICEEGCHIFNYEQGGYAQLSSLAVRAVKAKENLLTLDDVRDLIRFTDEHCVRTRLLCLENTHNRGAGRVLPYDGVVEMTSWAREHGLATHLDGARLFNAVVSSGIPASEWAQHFDTVSVCFSKGLGAPVGSALAGSEELIATAQWHRKLFGGGMRQAGIIAAGALYALEHHVERLAEDHANAQALADAIRRTDGLTLHTSAVDTNIVIFRVDPALGTAEEYVNRLAERGVLMLPFDGPLVRAVTHLDVSAGDIALVAKALTR